MMPFHDLRGYLSKLEEAGQLRTVHAEVDAHFEIGAVTRRVCERRDPAPLFDNIKGVPGHRMAGVLMGPSKPALHARIAIALGVHEMTSPLDLIEVYRERMKRPRQPVLIPKGEASCKEVVLLGEQASLATLPCPWIKEI